ncbi:hypothetical protein PybrP1_004813 [[Pythium] brassicae (nom. inval.)]|nr:hypothetical protein PybrP1_004813 [[Pythium] brassicae (nom. inval.)]
MCATPVISCRLDNQVLSSVNEQHNSSGDHGNQPPPNFEAIHMRETTTPITNRELQEDPEATPLPSPSDPEHQREATTASRLQPHDYSLQDTRVTKAAFYEEAQTRLTQIQEQHLTRQRRIERLAQARRQQQEMIAHQVREMEAQIKQQEAERHQRKLTFREAKERSLMRMEELAVLCWHAAVAQASEMARMAEEDRSSKRQRMFEQQEACRASQELSAMTFEEAHVRKWTRFEAERQRKERWREEKCVLRRRFNAVMIQLVATHEVNEVERMKTREAERRREARETTQMRSEELALRRFLAQQRALVEERRRTSEHRSMATEDNDSQTWALAVQRLRMSEWTLMESEDALVRALQTTAVAKRTQGENRLLMAKEEELSRRVQVLELQRQQMHVETAEACRRILLRCTRVANMGRALHEWKLRVAELRSEELAVRTIQRFCRDHRTRRGWSAERVCTEETAAAAAKLVQSTFRGFSIRRKFTNALTIAKLVENDVHEFGEVNLNDLIERPPELEDGWEDPVLPAYLSEQSRLDECTAEGVDANGSDGECNNSREEDESEEEDRIGGSGAYNRSARLGTAEHSRPVSRQERAEAVAMGIANVASPTTADVSLNDNVGRDDQDTTAAQAPPTGGLASAFWDKMRKMKQKQRRAAEERSREQDPTYRLQKLMKRGNKQQRQQVAASKSSGNQEAGCTPSATTSASTVLWGSTSSNGESKKPKVKLPSLVERLRKKTEAAR